MQEMIRGEDGQEKNKTAKAENLVCTIILLQSCAVWVGRGVRTLVGLEL